MVMALCPRDSHDGMDDTTTVASMAQGMNIFTMDDGFSSLTVGSPSPSYSHWFLDSPRDSGNISPIDIESSPPLASRTVPHQIQLLMIGMSLVSMNQENDSHNIPILTNGIPILLVPVYFLLWLNFLMISFPWYSNRIPMIFPWYSNRIPMISPWYSQYFSMIFPDHRHHRGSAQAAAPMSGRLVLSSVVTCRTTGTKWAVYEIAKLGNISPINQQTWLLFMLSNKVERSNNWCWTQVMGMGEWDYH